jgi:hypothetical protein
VVFDQLTEEEYGAKHKEFEVLHPQRMMSSRKIMEEMGGPCGLVRALRSDLKVSIVLMGQVIVLVQGLRGAVTSSGLLSRLECIVIEISSPTSRFVLKVLITMEAEFK